MGLPAEKIIIEALQLPTTLRAFVAKRLIESLDLDESSDISPQWRDEIARRCHEIECTDSRTVRQMLSWLGLYSTEMITHRVLPSL